MPSLPTCPDESTLWSFLQDQLTGEDAERIDDHLGGCPACQRALDRLVGSLPGRWLPAPDAAEGEATVTHAGTPSRGVRLPNPTDDPSAAATKADPAAGDPQAAVGSEAPREGGADPGGTTTWRPTGKTIPAPGFRQGVPGRSAATG